MTAQLLKPWKSISQTPRRKYCRLTPRQRKQCDRRGGGGCSRARRRQIVFYKTGPKNRPREVRTAHRRTLSRMTRRTLLSRRKNRNHPTQDPQKLGKIDSSRREHPRRSAPGRMGGQERAWVLCRPAGRNQFWGAPGTATAYYHVDLERGLIEWPMVRHVRAPRNARRPRRPQPEGRPQATKPSDQFGLACGYRARKCVAFRARQIQAPLTRFFARSWKRNSRNLFQAHIHRIEGRAPGAASLGLADSKARSAVVTWPLKANPRTSWGPQGNGKKKALGPPGGFATKVLDQ